MANHQLINCVYFVRKGGPYQTQIPRDHTKGKCQRTIPKANTKGPYQTQIPKGPYQRLTPNYHTKGKYQRTIPMANTKGPYQRQTPKNHTKGKHQRTIPKANTKGKQYRFFHSCFNASSENWKWLSFHILEIQPYKKNTAHFGPYMLQFSGWKYWTDTVFRHIWLSSELLEHNHFLNHNPLSYYNNQ